MIIKNYSFQKKPISYTYKKKIIEENFSNLNDGVNHLKDLIIFKEKNKIKIYDRICNHNGGRLISKADKKIVCPLHNWQFNPESGKYLNNKCEKKSLEFELDRDQLKIKLNIKTPIFSQSELTKKTKITFLNHACLIIETESIKFATDPWLFGPAFSRGWWLYKKSPKNSVQLINECDFIYVSHNHPDHLHPLTLSRIDKTKIIITPKFKNNSTSNYLSSLGFKNIITLDFGYEFSSKELDICISLLKSGDFRDDSGMYFSNGKFKSIISVDSNFLNFLELPQNISLLASSFAGGASGYPLCFANISNKQKKEIVNRNKNSLKITNQKMLKTTKAKYFLPYAGFFTESAERDKFIKENNYKNKISDYKDMCQKNNTYLLDVDHNQNFHFDGEEISKKFENCKKNIFLDKSQIEYINQAKKKYFNINQNKINKYFEDSNFKENLILKIILQDDNFSKFFLGFTVNFCTSKPTVNYFKKENETAIEDINKEFSAKVLEIKVRIESFLEIIEEKLPWEDLLIGFQTKIKRIPDTYNANFWYYFTNVYIKKDLIRYESECNSCTTISQSLDKAYV